MNLTQPTNTQFQQAQETLTNLLQDYSSQIDTKKASVVRQLLIRPYAYIYAKLNQMFTQWLTKTSVAYLSKSQQTSNSVADTVASNYFVTRKQGAYARGVVTLTCTAASVRISKGSQFTADGNLFVADKTCLATISPLQDTDQINYIKMQQVNGVYKVNVPVVATQPGYMQIPQGVQCTLNSYIANVQSVELTSAITGGSSSQTDAQMMQRCKDRCGSAIGTLGAIRIKMQQAPVQVFSCNAVGSAQPGCFRSRYNNLDIPYGGVVDIYAKTANQSSIQLLSYQSLLRDSQSYYLDIDSADNPDISGFIRIVSVTSTSDIPVGTYTVQYLSNDPLVSAQGARLTGKQKARIRFRKELTQSIPVLVSVQYMAGIRDLQEYMDSTSGAFLGQDCYVKAALPATVHVKGNVYSAQPVSQDLLQELKSFVAKYICQWKVGQYTLNMDQVAEAVQRVYPDINLRLPYTIQVSMPMTNGGSYNFVTTDGTVDLAYRQGMYYWDKASYFFSTAPSYIDLQVL